MPHVCLVAFTGLRVREPALAELGMSLPGLSRRGAAIAALPALGLLTLAAHNPPGWSSSWHEPGEGGLEELLETVSARTPDLVAISALTASITEAYAFARAARGRGLAVAIGGLHASTLPDEAARTCDVVVVGEGESVWPGLLQDAAAGQLRPRYQAEPFDLSQARVPSYELLGPARRPRYTLQTQRGCPFACDFCGASRLLGGHRQKPADRVGAELTALRAHVSGPLRIELADDNTFAGRADADALLTALGSAGARWFTESDWRIGERPELLERLAAAGCQQILVGVEGLRPRHRGMGAKTAELGRIDDALRAIQTAGVPVNACFVVGADGETRASLDALGDHLERAPYAEVQLTLQTPFPGTALRRRLARAGRILAGRGWEHHTLFDLTYQPDAMSVEELERGFRGLLARTFAPAACARREAIRREILRTARERRRLTA